MAYPVSDPEFFAAQIPQRSLSSSLSTPAIVTATLLLVLASAAPAMAQRCSTQNGQTICCDNSGNCYSK
jgi:hypothetical protein